VETTSEIIGLDHDDLDAVRVVISQSLFPMSFDLLHPPWAAPAFRFRGRIVRTGPFILGEATYTAGLRIGMPTIGAVYYLNLPGVGSSLTAECRGGPVIGSPNQGLLLRPGDSTWVRTCDEYHSNAIMIERDALECQLGAQSGDTPTGPIRFAPSLDLASGPAAGWARLVRWFAGEIATPDSLLTDPLIAEPLHEAVLMGLLAMAEHPHRQAMAGRVPSWGPSPVRRAMDEVMVHAAEPITVSRLAAVACVSVRSLQEGFRRHLGKSPTQYLREVRLARAHEDLRLADPGQATVTRIAHSWGFTNVGRFATTYAQRYGRHPSETLRCCNLGSGLMGERSADSPP
jgi:AraC-like DNA-binding protein